MIKNIKKINWISVLFISLFFWFIFVWTYQKIVWEYEHKIKWEEDFIVLKEYEQSNIEMRKILRKRLNQVAEIEAALEKKSVIETWFLVSLVPERQPKIISHNYLDNNKVIHKYLSKEKYNVTLPTDKGIILVRFVTSKPIAKNREIFLAINGKTVGRLDKSRQVELYTDSWNWDYLDLWDTLVYYARAIPLIGNKWYKYTIDLEELNTFSINAVVWETNNFVKEIHLYSI